MSVSTALTWPADQWNQIKIVSNSSVNNFPGLCVRTDTTATGYCAFFKGALGGPTSCFVVKYITTVQTVLNSSTCTVNANDVVYIEVQGTTIQVAINGSFVAGLNTADTSISSGSPALFGNGSSATFSMDDWSGGDFSVTTPGTKISGPAKVSGPAKMVSVPIPPPLPINFVADGDSITAGFEGTAYTTLLTLNISSTITNVGVSGKTICQLVVDAPAKVDTLLVPSTTNNNIVGIWAGTNDAAAGTSVADTYACLEAYVNARRAAGWRVIVMQMISRVGQDVFKNAYNALISAGWTANAQGYVTFSALLSADGAYANTTYFNVDQIHPQTLSDTTLIAPVISTAINGIIQ
jgi:hypothetical protein